MNLRKLLLLISAFSLSALSVSAYDLDMGDFNELKVSGGINVDYICSPDSAGHVYFDCPPEMVSCIMFTNKSGKLNIQLSPENKVSSGLPVIKVCSRFLSKASNYSDSTLRVLHIKETPSFEGLLEGNGRLVIHGIDATKVKLISRMGHGTIVADGKCGEATYSLFGTGVIQADELHAAEVTVKCNGTGSIGVDAVKTLDVYGSGSTSVYYVGDPVVKKRAIGVKLMPLGSGKSEQ